MTIEDDVTQPVIVLPDEPLKTVAFLQSQHYTPAARTEFRWIVIHDMESPEAIHTADDCARWMAGLNPHYHAPRASAHYYCDSGVAIQGVREKDVAWHAPGANRLGIGIEHAGFARQTSAEWLDEYGRKMLSLSATLCAAICRRRSIPAVFVDHDGLIAGEPGITTHAEVNAAFHRSDHTDPGVGFPLETYIAAVRVAMARRAV